MTVKGFGDTQDYRGQPMLCSSLKSPSLLTRSKAFASSMKAMNRLVYLFLLELTDGEHHANGGPFGTQAAL